MDRHLVLIGASRGLGRVFAQMAVERGYAASVLSRAPEAGAGTARHEWSARHYRCDITRPQDVAAALEALVRERGEIHGMVFFQRYRGADDAWEGEMRTSLTAVRQVIEQSAPYFAAGGHPRSGSTKAIVLVSSINAAFISPQLPCGYHVAKAGLCQMARYYACALGSRGIRVNAVCPSTFLKPENEEFYRNHPDIVRRLEQSSPLNRMGTCAEVANAVFFLLSDEASFITGQSLTVDGGISLRWPEHTDIAAPATVPMS